MVVFTASSFAGCRMTCLIIPGNSHSYWNGLVPLGLFVAALDDFLPMHPIFACDASLVYNPELCAHIMI